MIELLSNAGFIMYSKKAARLFGVNGAILLGELCAKYQYWLDNGGLLENEGWFFCTREDIEADTMLSSFQQREAMHKRRCALHHDVKKLNAKASRNFTA